MMSQSDLNPSFLGRFCACSVRVLCKVHRNTSWKDESSAICLSAHTASPDDCISSVRYHRMILAAEAMLVLAAGLLH